jgi:hypothetical protein
MDSQSTTLLLVVVMVKMARSLVKMVAREDQFTMMFVPNSLPTAKRNSKNTKRWLLLLARMK